MNLRFEDLPDLEEWWKAIRWTLLVFTLLVVLTMAGSFISYERVVTEGHPWLPLQRCPGCPLCGMTRSFCAMSAGLFTDAWRWNSAGPFLYAFGWLWLTAFLIFAGKISKRYFAGRKQEIISPN